MDPWKKTTFLGVEEQGDQMSLWKFAQNVAQPIFGKNYIIHDFDDGKT
jgi:hypothetical protein